MRARSRCRPATEMVRSGNRQTLPSSAAKSPSPQNGDDDMTNEDVQDFVTRFAAAWAARDGNAFLELWHPEGSLYTPLVDRRLAGSELPRLLELQAAAAPDFVWQLLDWTSRGNVVIIEWQTTRN